MADIVINEADLPNPLEEKLHANTDGTQIQLGKDKSLTVQLGAPLDNGGVFHFPANPHVFITNQLFVRDKDHQQGMVLDDVPVIMAHGLRINNEWKFLNGQSVNDTVSEYNKWAALNKMPILEAVIACNEGPVSEGPNIQIHEFPKEAQNPFVIHAVGEKVWSSCFRWPNGKSWTKIETNETSLLNLDEAITTRQIKILP